jgi:hypothetical protein
MTLTRSNRIPPTRQREIEALADGITPQSLGEFNASFMTQHLLAYMGQGRAFGVVYRNDAEFVTLLEQNLSDIRSSRVSL